MSDTPSHRGLDDAVRRATRVELPKRFYKEVSLAERDGAFAILLDGRQVRTPAKLVLAVADRALAKAVAAEWAAQGETIDPSTMPATRLVNVALDRVAGEIAAVRAEIVQYAGSDMICYRADGPDSLIAAEEAAWSPLIAWAREALGARLILAEGVMHAAQDAGAIAAIDRALGEEGADPLRLAALHAATTLTGSAVIALALARGRLSAGEAWAAAHVDEDWQMAQWGTDEPALHRRALRRREFDAAALVLGARR